MRVAAVILAGGEGRRIGGGKPLKALGGQSLIERAEALAGQWSDIVAVAVRDPAQVGAASAACILDDQGIEGPLGGLAAALRFARHAGREAVLTVPVDMPFLPPDLGQRLAAAIGDCAAAAAASGGKLHPVCALWRLPVLDALPGYLESGRRSLRGLAEAVGCARVEWADSPIDPFFNINSPDDLESAQRLVGH